MTADEPERDRSRGGIFPHGYAINIQAVNKPNADSALFDADLLVMTGERMTSGSGRRRSPGEPA